MPRLSVNLNKVALVRNARSPQGTGRPDVAALAHLVLDAGAHGLTLHPRPDGRHARADDVRALARLAADAGAEMNVEGNPFEGPTGDPATGFPGFDALVAETRPAQATFVPDAPAQTTSDHGWPLADGRFADHDRLAAAVARTRALGVRVSLFVDADPAAVRAAAAVGADRVELYTGPYALAHARGDSRAALAALAAAAAEAGRLGLGLNAGHDLDLANLGPLCAALPALAEVSIGQALVADALECGLPSAVRAYLRVLRRAG